MDTFKSILTRTLHWLTEDQELEEFVAGIPGLYESEAFSRVGAYLDDSRRDDIQRTLDNIFPVLADLPGPMGFDAPLPWSIIRLAQRSIASNLSKPIQHIGNWGNLFFQVLKPQKRLKTVKNEVKPMKLGDSETQVECPGNLDW